MAGVAALLAPTCRCSINIGLERGAGPELAFVSRCYACNLDADTQANSLLMQLVNWHRLAQCAVLRADA